MFITQANVMSPVVGGVNSTITGSFSGNAFLIFNYGNTTSAPRVLSVIRTNVLLVCQRVWSLSQAHSPARHDYLPVWASSLLRPSLDDAGVALTFAGVPAGLRPRRSRSALTKKLPSVTTMSPG
jgi:hypothetical protein